jgi:hypothetical protein
MQYFFIDLSSIFIGFFVTLYIMKSKPRWKLLTFLVWGMAFVGVFLIFAPPSILPSFYVPQFMGIGALIFSLLILLPEWIFQTDDEKKLKARDHLQISLALCFVLSGMGELGLWQLYLIGFQYDKFVHIIVPALLTISGTHFVEAWWGIRWNRTLIGMVIGVGVASIGWEAIEFYSDRIFGTQLFGVYGTQISQDTIVDVLCDAIGIGIAIIIRQQERLKAITRT